MWQLFCVRKVNCPKARANTRFQPCVVDTKVVYINICSYPAMFCAFIVGKPPDKKGDIDQVLSPCTQ